MSGQVNKSLVYLAKTIKVAFFVSLSLAFFLLLTVLNTKKRGGLWFESGLSVNPQPYGNAVSMHGTGQRRPSSDSLVESLDHRTCEPQSNIVFIKTHKCASSSIQNLLMRFGYTHNKVLVLPAKDNYLGHPDLFNRTLVPKPSDFEFNILTHHSRLNYPEMRALMPNNTLFVTIVRNPEDLFESMFNYYKFRNIFKFSLQEFEKQRDYNIPLKLYTHRYLGKLGLNQMLFDLGMDPLSFLEPKAVQEYITRLDSIFDLVLVADRMEESLVLLKHLFCWKTFDMVVFKVNARSTKSNLSDLARSRIKSLNWSDNMLYQHFKSQFQKRVSTFGINRMAKEMRALRAATDNWYKYCVAREVSSRNSSTSVVVRLVNKHQEDITCWMLTAKELDFTRFVRRKQLERYPASVFKYRNKKLISRFKLSKRAAPEGLS